MGFVISAAIIVFVVVVATVSGEMARFKNGSGSSVGEEKSDNTWFDRDSTTGHTHKCDGNCDNCPDHYGYRYGRWYYGHGHQHGCERGGNGGASGRTYRD